MSAKAHTIQRANCGVEMDIRKVILKTEFEVGPIDVFISNAGIPANGGTEVPNDEWDRIWRVNVMQHVFVARHLFPLYKSRGYGAMLITASAAGLLTQIGSLPYSVTKHAAVSVAEWLQIAHRSDNIRISCLCPQAVKTGMVPEGGDGGVAGSDGTLDPNDVAAESIQVLSRGEFLVLPHKKVKVYMQRKAADYDRWLRGMHRVHVAMGEIMRKTPPISAAKL